MPHEGARKPTKPKAAELAQTPPMCPERDRDFPTQEASVSPSSPSMDRKLLSCKHGSSVTAKGRNLRECAENLEPEPLVQDWSPTRPQKRKTWPHTPGWISTPPFALCFSSIGKGMSPAAAVPLALHAWRQQVTFHFGGRGEWGFL